METSVEPMVNPWFWTFVSICFAVPCPMFVYSITVKGWYQEFGGSGDGR